MTIRRATVISVAVLAMLSGGVVAADGLGCGQPPLTGGYGNAGFAAGYSSWIGGVGAGSCIAPPACGPCWRPCLPRRCVPNPCWGGGYGSSRSLWSDTVFVAGPGLGGGTFFSGGVRSVVVPTIWYPWGYGCGPLYGGVLFSPYGTWLPAGYGPTFGPAGVFPFLNVFGANVRPAALASIDRRPAIRVSNAEARGRAWKLVAVGDRHMRAAIDAPGKLTSALDAYRRAARIAPDLPEVYVRQAIASVALDRDDAATRAIATLTAIDPRLTDDIDARGRTVLAEIWTGPGVAGAPLAAPDHWITARWAQRWGQGLAAVAAAPVGAAAAAVQ